MAPSRTIAGAAKGKAALVRLVTNNGEKLTVNQESTRESLCIETSEMLEYDRGVRQAGLYRDREAHDLRAWVPSSA